MSTEDIKKTTKKKASKQDLTALERARKQNVAKRNDMIQKSKKSLSVVENKAVSYIFSKVKPDDDPDTIYRFDCQEFYRLLRWRKQSYTDLKAMLYSIASQTFGIIDDETGTEKIVHWFNTIHLKRDKDGKIVSDSKSSGRFVEIKIHEDLMEYVFGLEQQRRENNIFYSAYQLQNVSMLTHTYSQNLYELLKTYENVGRWKFEYGTGTENDIQMRLATYTPEMEPQESAENKGRGGRKKRVVYGKTKLVPVIPNSWRSFHFFERDVLKPVKKEINTFTDIEFEYEASKIDIHGVKRRKFSTITFYIRRKTAAQKQQTEKIIDDAYKDFDEEKKYKQMDLSEFLESIDLPPEDDRERQKREQDEKEKKKEKAINSAVYKVAASVFYDDFKQKEIQHLVEAAIRHISPLRVKQSNREMWAIDFISFYYDKIKATEDETRTTPYRRLLDCVTKDYDEYAERLTVYDEHESYGDAVSDEAEFMEYDGYVQEEKEPEDRNTRSIKVSETSAVAGEFGSADDIEHLTLEELDERIARMKKLLELAEIQKQVKELE